MRNDVEQYVEGFKKLCTGTGTKGTIQFRTYVELLLFILCRKFYSLLNEPKTTFQ